MTVAAQKIDGLGRRIDACTDSARFARCARAELLRHSGQALRMPMDPRRQPAADVAAAGYGGKIVELFEEAIGGEPGKHAKPERRAANAAAGQTQRAANAVGSMQPAYIFEQSIQPH